jgi:hypothetical protein
MKDIRRAVERRTGGGTEPVEPTAAPPAVKA